MVLRNRPRPAVIITLQRTGGSFLAFCLSTHPEIFCARGEPLSQRSYWREACPESVKLLDLILRQQYYAVSMCKLIDNHAFDAGVWRYLTTCDPPVKVLWLERENVLAQAVSHEINAGRREGRIHGHPTHAFHEVDPPPVRLSPAGVLNRCRSEWARYAQARGKLRKSGLQIARLTYWEITGGEDTNSIPTETAERICRFLGVPAMELHGAGMRKVHRRPLGETVENWGEVVKAIRGTKFEKFLDDKWEGR